MASSGAVQALRYSGSEKNDSTVSSRRVVERIRHHLDAPFWTAGSTVENVVDGTHPTKRELYGGYARAHGLPVPTFLDGGADGKVVRRGNRRRHSQ